jgi:hypothetical protein
MRRLRNRVHIQNERKDLDPLEFNAFTERRKTQAEELLVTTMNTMAGKYGRDPNSPFSLASITGLGDAADDAAVHTNRRTGGRRCHLAAKIDHGVRHFFGRGPTLDERGGT